MTDLHLSTPRLILRTPVPSDAPSLTSLFSNALNTRFEPHQPSSLSAESFVKPIERFRRNTAEGSAGQLMLVERGQDGRGGATIGIGGINGFEVDVNRGESVADVGLMIDSSRWRMGYGREVLVHLLDFALDEGEQGAGRVLLARAKPAAATEEIRVGSVKMQTMADNAPFRALVASLGLEPCGTEGDGPGFREITYRIDREAWREAKTRA